MNRSILSTHPYSTRFGAIAILVLVLALGLTAFESAPNHRFVAAAVQITPVSISLPSKLPVPAEQKMVIAGGYWLVTNPETGQFIRVEMSTNDQLQTPAEQKVSIGGHYMLVTNPENGHFIRVEVTPR